MLFDTITPELLSCVMFDMLYLSCLTEDMLFDTITPELLRTDKMFLKLLRKQQREIEMLKKKHGKEKSIILKQHCTVIDHMMASHDRDKQGHERTLEKAIKKKGCVKNVGVLGNSIK